MRFLFHLVLNQFLNQFICPLSDKTSTTPCQNLEIFKDSLLQPQPSSGTILCLISRHQKLSSPKPRVSQHHCLFCYYMSVQFPQLSGAASRTSKVKVEKRSGKKSASFCLGEQNDLYPPQNWQVLYCEYICFITLKNFNWGCALALRWRTNWQFDAFQMVRSQDGNGTHNKHPSLCGDTALLSCSRSRLNQQRLNIPANNYCQKHFLCPNHSNCVWNTPFHIHMSYGK